MHFSVGGAQIAAWVSMKSFAKNGSGDPPGLGRDGERDFDGGRSTNAMHASRTDPRRSSSKGARQRRQLRFIRGEPQQADRRGDRRCQARGGRSDDRAPFPGRRITLGANKGYDATADRLSHFLDVNVPTRPSIDYLPSCCQYWSQEWLRSIHSCAANVIADCCGKQDARCSLQLEHK
jgi:hypothetical protein